MKTLRRIATVAYSTHLESVRQRLFVGLMVLSFLLLSSAMVLKEISVQQDLKILMDIGLASTEFFGTLAAIFLGADLVSRDVERKTVHLLLVKPLTRTEFIVGRYLGLASTLLTSVCLMGAGLALALVVAGGSFRAGLVKALFAIFLQLAVTAGVSTFLSTAASRPLALMGSTVICVLGRMSDVLKNASLIIEGFPEWLGKSIYYLVPNLRTFDLKTRAVYGDQLPSAIFIDLTIYALVYTTAMLALSALVFRRRDLK